MNKSFAVSLLVLAPFIASCSFSSASPSKTNDGSSAGDESSSAQDVSSSDVSSSGASSSSSFLVPDGGSATELFDLSKDVKIRLEFSNAALYDLSSYGAKDNKKWGDVYFPCTMFLELPSFNGTPLIFEEVGARMKGNTSRSEFVSSDGTINKASHFKLSFKCTFDDEMYDLDSFKAYKHDWSSDADGRKTRKKRTLFGLEKLDMKYVPRNNGSSISQESYIYSKFIEAGIPTSRTQLASVTLKDGKGELQSGYELVEPIDKPFLKRWFPDDYDGDLYKCTWGASKGGSWVGADLSRSDAVEKNASGDVLQSGERIPSGRIGVEDNYAEYHPCYDLKTNDDGENSDFSMMSNYINSIYQLRYQSQSVDLLHDVLDVDEFLKFEALAYLFGNFDDQRNNANNYYLYFSKTTKKAIYIPYDWDWGLGLSAGNIENPSSYLPFKNTDMNGAEITTNVYFVTFLDGTSASPSYSLEDTKNTYSSYIKEYLNKGYLQESTYSSFLSASAYSSPSEIDAVKDYLKNKTSTIKNYYGI